MKVATLPPARLTLHFTDTEVSLRLMRDVDPSQGPASRHIWVLGETKQSLVKGGHIWQVPGTKPGLQQALSIYVRARNGERECDGSPSLALLF